MGGEFKWRHFAGELILLCVRWYCKYGISHRDLEEMMGERGVGVDHTTLYRWVQRYGPELEEADAVVPEPDQLLLAGRRDLHPRQGPMAVPGTGRSTKVARRSTSISPIGATPRRRSGFSPKALRRARDWTPQVINTNKNPAYGEAIAELKKEGLLPKEARHRQVKYLNNRLEGDHGKLKRLIKPTLGFQSMKTAVSATIKGFEAMRMFRKGQFRLWIEAAGGGTEASFVNRLFGVYA